MSIGSAPRTSSRPTDAEVAADPADGAIAPSRGTPSRTTRRRVLRIVVLAVLLLGLVLAALASTAAAWGGQLRADGRLLPGTTVAGVDVGGHTVEEARAAVGGVLADWLDREITLVHEAQAWTLTPRELEAGTDLDAVLAAATARTDAASVAELTRLRWLPRGAHEDLVVAVALPPGAVEGLVYDLGAQLDRTPVDAVLAWTDGAPAVTDAVDGRALEVGAALAAIRAALLDTGPDAVDEVTLPVAVVDPEVSTALAGQAGDLAATAAAEALERSVRLVLDDDTWQVSAQELDAEVDGEALVEAALAAVLASTTPASPPVALHYPDGALDAFVASIAAEVNVASRSASASWNGSLQITGEQAGVALERDAALDALRAALDGAADQVELATRATTPALTRTSFGRYLLLQQSSRTLQLREGDTVLREWPVAVGTNNSPTPTGTFVVGAKRFEPTWVNPAPTRWGRDMPARIGPGPDNPLGVRALNWNRPGGGDTLIRFHGTPNEASIGQAASNGCVRMFNAHVIELYDLVATGIPIVSVA